MLYRKLLVVAGCLLLSSIAPALSQDISVNDRQNPSCFWINEVQQCWGLAVVSNEQSVDNTFIHTFTVKFPRPFASPPTVVDSIQANYPRSAPVYGIYTSTITAEEWRGTLIRLRGGEGVNPPELKLPYIAIGKRK